MCHGNECGLEIGGFRYYQLWFLVQAGGDLIQDVVHEDVIRCAIVVRVMA